MSNRELRHQGAPHPFGRTAGFVDSYGFFALMVMSFFVVAIALYIVGFTAPSWLGFG